MKVILVAGARPNFMKIAPIMAAMEKYNTTNGRFFKPYLVHTGQHYDMEMSRIFFDELNIPAPNINLEVGSGSHARQTAAVMEAIEKVFVEQKPELVIVVGDINSTMAAAIAASKLCVPVAHVEAGLRSFDRTMPEEINRMVTDVLSDMLFTTDQVANENLAREGIDPEKVFFVGDVMIDTLYNNMKAINASDCPGRLGLKSREYAVLTLHRPSNVDDSNILRGVLKVLEDISKRIKILFARHPRTKNRMEKFGFQGNGLTIVDPLGYIDFMRLVKDSRFVITDSGGMQEESTVLGKPCLTLRYNTERPITLEKGTNVLVGNDPERIKEAASAVLDGKGKTNEIPELWDGHAAVRIVDVLATHAGGSIGGSCGNGNNSGVVGLARLL